MNSIRLAGYVDSEPRFSHKTFGEDFYIFQLSVYRKSNIADVIPCIIPSTLLGMVTKDAKIDVVGEIRTRNVADVDKRRCETNVFVSEIHEFSSDNLNHVKLHGFICKEPVYRETPFGRQISDLVVACQRERTNKSDYIHSIAWGRNALRAASMEVGTEVDIEGRLQSRPYEKKHEDGSFEIKIAYELSISRIEVINHE